MKLNGRTFSKPNTDIVVIPRPDGNVVFRVQAVLDYTPFESLCPDPTPPTIRRPGQEPTPDFSDAEYRRKANLRNNAFMDWLYLESLKATENLEWETVDYTDPETLKNWRKELSDSFFTNAEIRLIADAALKVNSLDEDQLTEARNSFLASMGDQQEK